MHWKKSTGSYLCIRDVHLVVKLFAEWPPTTNYADKYRCIFSNHSFPSLLDHFLGSSHISGGEDIRTIDSMLELDNRSCRLRHTPSTFVGLWC